MATIILRDAGSISSPGSIAKGSPLTNLEVDNNFSNINLTTGVLSNLTNFNSGNVANLVSAINELGANTGVTANTYGGAAVHTIITVNSKGKITSASNVAATIANTSIVGNITINQIQPAGATAGTYGGATAIPVITVDYAGRISNVGNVGIIVGQTPGGSNTQIQFNNSNVFGGSSSFTWDGSSITAPQSIASNGLFVNNQTINSSYSIPDGYSATSSGPITLASNVNVTLGNNSRWVIL
jgi:hypothetical protein